MVVMTCLEMLKAHCKATGLWGMYISLPPTDDYVNVHEIMKAAPYLKERALLYDTVGVGFLFFPTEDKMRAAYNQTVGDDGPRGTNSYDGPARVYAVTCAPSGQLLNENT